MKHSFRRALVSLVSTAAIVAVAAPAMALTYNTYGDQSWNSGTQTGRYRAHSGTHYIQPWAQGGGGCPSGSHRYIDLRVDVINNPDYSEFYGNITCNLYWSYPGRYDSYNSAYRGHFMQSWNVNWYGSLTDAHN